MKVGAAVTTPGGVCGRLRRIDTSMVQWYLSQNTRPKKPGARPWMRHTLVHNGRRVSPGRVRYATSRLDETRAVVRFEHH